MGEPFDAIGFRVGDEAAYQALAEEAHQRGAVSRVQREQATLHGCCWRLGDGLEVWTVLHESQQGLFFADCRPAFRGRHLFALYPWEIIEYEEDGEAVARGIIDPGVELTFELQNITEIDPADFCERAITATVSGLAYRARLHAKPRESLFVRLSQHQPRRRAAENDYIVRGTILSWREIKNPCTTSDLVWVDIDTGKVQIEILINRSDLKGELQRGALISAEVWLQGHVLNDHQMRARYEGVDFNTPRADFWRKLRRPH